MTPRSAQEISPKHRDIVSPGTGVPTEASFTLAFMKELKQSIILGHHHLVDIRKFRRTALAFVAAQKDQHNITTFAIDYQKYMIAVPTFGFRKGI